MGKGIPLVLLRVYKRFVSPALLPACRYVPTCSEYAAEAIEGRGLLRGGLLALYRLLRCNPFARGGYDPVPNLTEFPVSSFQSRRPTHDCFGTGNRKLETGNF